MLNVEIATRSCSDETAQVSNLYAGLRKEGFVVEHVFASYERGRGSKVIMIGIKQTEEQPEEEGKNG